MTIIQIQEIYNAQNVLQRMKINVRFTFGFGVGDTKLAICN